MKKTASFRKRRSIEEINRKIKRGEAVILTAQELCEAVRNGKKIKLSDVDVVTAASCGLMSGSSAVLSFPVCGRDVFIRAKSVLLNGVPALPGPAPNERLGEIDTIVYATSASVYDRKYGGGHLFRDLVAGEEIEVEVESIEGKKIEANVDIGCMTYARFFGTRNLFKNYMAFINKKRNSVKTIFHVKPIEGSCKEASVCGVGELNPLEKDPGLKTIGVGTRVLINGAVGYVSGLGTRSTPEKPCLSGFADMYTMNPKYMGGFATSYALESIVTWAVPIPITGEDMLNSAKALDEDIALPVADINDRIPFYSSTYSSVWQGTDLTIKFSREKCIDCKTCDVEKICPTGAFENKTVNKTLCFECGACVSACRGGAFLGNLGKISVDGRGIPIGIRQSNRKRAAEISAELKKMIESREFFLTEPLETLKFEEKDNIPCRFCNRDFCRGKK